MLNYAMQRSRKQKAPSFNVEPIVDIEGTRTEEHEIVNKKAKTQDTAVSSESIDQQLERIDVHETIADVPRWRKHFKHVPNTVLLNKDKLDESTEHGAHFGGNAVKLTIEDSMLPPNANGESAGVGVFIQPKSIVRAGDILSEYGGEAEWILEKDLDDVQRRSRKVKDRSRTLCLYDADEGIDIIDADKDGDTEDNLSDLWTVKERSSTINSTGTSSSQGSSSKAYSLDTYEVLSRCNSTKSEMGRHSKRPCHREFTEKLLHCDCVKDTLAVLNGKYDSPCCKNKECIYVTRVRKLREINGGGSGEADQEDVVEVIRSGIVHNVLDCMQQCRTMTSKKTQKERGEWVKDQIRSAWVRSAGSSSRQSMSVATAAAGGAYDDGDKESILAESSLTVENPHETYISATQKDDFDIYLKVEYVSSADGITYRHNVCAKAWRHFYGISKKMYYAKVKEVKENQSSVSELNKVARNLIEDNPECAERSTVVNECVAYVKCFAEQYGEHNPKVYGTRINFDRKYVYESFVKRKGRGSVFSLSYFYKIWNHYLADIKRCAWKGDHLQCDTCLKLSLKDCNPHLSAAEHKVIREELQNHRATVQECRDEYFLRKEKARCYPGTFLSLIVDGCDQNKTHLPFFVNKSKEADKFNRFMIQHKLMGVIVHGAYNRVYNYLVPPNAADKKGSNLTIEVIQRTLHKERQRRLSAGAPWPDTLFLQLDNASGENKNKYIFAYLSYLVKTGVFKTVYVNFHLVGHTHEDIDQFFSQYAGKARYTDCITFMDMSDLLKSCGAESDQIVEEPEYVFTMHDWRSWMEESVNTAYTGFRSAAYHYKIEKSMDRIVCFYAEHSYHVTGPDGQHNYLPKKPYQPSSWLNDKEIVGLPSVDHTAGSWEGSPYWQLCKEENKNKKSFKMSHKECIVYMLQGLAGLLQLDSNKAGEAHIEWWRYMLTTRMPQPGEIIEPELRCDDIFDVFEKYVLPEGRPTAETGEYYDRREYVGVPNPAWTTDQLLFRGFTAAQRSQVQRIETDISLAGTLKPIPKNCFLVFMVSEDWANLGADQNNLRPESTSLPFTLGKAMTAEETCVPNAKLKVHVWYTLYGNPNDAWKPWIHQGKGQRKWIIEISRECVALFGVELTSQSKITRKSAITLGEVPGFPYIYVPGKGMITKVSAAAELEKDIRKLKRKKDATTVTKAKGLESKLNHLKNCIRLLSQAIPSYQAPDNVGEFTIAEDADEDLAES